MGFFDDYTTAIETYPTDYVSLEIVNVNPSVGTSVNVNERVSFDVRVKNAGPLRMADLRVRIKGLNGILVKDAAATAPFVTEFVTSAGQFPLIDAHDTVNAGENVGGFEFKTPLNPMPERDLVEVSVEDWTADIAHMHTSHSDPAPGVKAIHRDQVRAS